MKVYFLLFISYCDEIGYAYEKSTCFTSLQIKKMSPI